MRSGGVAKTSAINSEAFTEAFEKILSSGKDILYLGFSSGLSTTYNSATLAAAALNAKYPERKIITVDTLAASAGEGLAVYLTNEKKKAGATIEEAAEYAKELCPKICHWFTVDDLVYLKRGGRVSPTVAFVGNLLGIKPVLHVDNEGHLTPVCKVRGRRTSLDTIVAKYGELALDAANGPIFISHAQCMSDVEYVCAQIEAKYGNKVALVTDVGSVIGSHAGPGTFAFFFLAKER
jgi:DegV family protein with EDD domain